MQFSKKWEKLPFLVSLGQKGPFWVIFGQKGHFLIFGEKENYNAQILMKIGTNERMEVKGPSNLPRDQKESLFANTQKNITSIIRFPSKWI